MKSPKSMGNSPIVAPILPLRDMVVFPHVLIPLFLKGSRVVKLAESLADGDNLVGLFYQRTQNRISSVREEISVIGTLARIQQVVHLENGGVKAIADGISRIRLVRQTQTEPYIMGEVEFIDEQSEPQELLDTLVRSVAALFRITLSLGRPISDHWAAMIEKAEDPGRLADLICVYLPLKADVKQGLLEIEDPLARLKKAFLYLQTDVQAHYPKLQTAGEMASGALGSKKQKELDLRQQMRSIQRELGAGEGTQGCEAQEFQEKIRTSGMPDDAVEVATREVQRLERIPPHSPEYIVSRTYL